MPTTITETPDFDLTVDGDSVTLTLTGAIPIISSASSSDGTADLYVERISFNTSNGGPTEQGELAWESSSGTLQAALESGVVAPVGESGLIRVRNTSGVTIPKGAALYYTGTVGASGRLEVAKWAGANVTDVDLFMGFAAAQMLNNSNGYAVWFGKLSGIDTDGSDEGEVWADGDVLYAIPSGSSYLTKTEPASGDYVVAAAIINAGSGTSGSIMVRPHFHETVTSADITDATDGATPETIVKRDASGGASFTLVTVGPAYLGEKYISLGDQDDTYLCTITSPSSTDNRIATLPDASGTLALTDQLDGTIPISVVTNLQTELDSKADIDSPTFTGTVTIPHAAEIGDLVSVGAIEFTNPNFSFDTGVDAAFRDALGIPTYADLTAANAALNAGDIYYDTALGVLRAATA